VEPSLGPSWLPSGSNNKLKKIYVGSLFSLIRHCAFDGTDLLDLVFFQVRILDFPKLNLSLMSTTIFYPLGSSTVLHN
jgi:hypothetical protein